MSKEPTAALVEDIEASCGLPVPTPREYATRIEQQLAARGFAIYAQPKPLCVCTGDGWPHPPSSERCTLPPDGKP